MCAADPISIAMRGAALAPNRDELIAENRQLLDRLRTGQLREKRDFDRLAKAVLIADELRRFSLATDHQRTFEAAFDALVAVSRRKAGRSHYIARGPELEALSLALDVHAVQLQHAAMREIEEAQRRVLAQQQTIQGGKAA